MSTSDLITLKAEADRLSDAFDVACRPHFVSRWDYYRAVECGEKCPQSVHTACDAYLTALHAYFLARDGARGFLGSRGL